MADNNMVNDIVNDIAKLSSRVDGLETAGSNAISVSRINKVYPKVQLKLTLRTFKQRKIYPSDSLFGGPNQYHIGGNTVLQNMGV